MCTGDRGPQLLAGSGPWPERGSSRAGRDRAFTGGESSPGEDSGEGGRRGLGVQGGCEAQGTQTYLSPRNPASSVTIPTSSYTLLPATHKKVQLGAPQGSAVWTWGLWVLLEASAALPPASSVFERLFFSFLFFFFLRGRAVAGKSRLSNSEPSALLLLLFY